MILRDDSQPVASGRVANRRITINYTDNYAQKFPYKNIKQILLNFSYCVNESKILYKI